MSIEVDILPIADGNDETARLADLIEGVAGEFSPFEELHGFSIDGVDLDTSVLPDGWRDRLVKVQNVNTAPPSGDPASPAGALTKGRPLRRKADRFPREGSQERPRSLGSARGIELAPNEADGCRLLIRERPSRTPPISTVIPSDGVPSACGCQ
jgi:hypothetical protein